MTVVILPEVLDFLDELVFKLYKQDYFAFKEDARQYVYNIHDSIPTVIERQTHKRSPTKLRRRGESYVTYNTTDRTTWYIFFSVDGERYVVEFITNNHAPDAVSFNID